MLEAILVEVEWESIAGSRLRFDVIPGLGPQIARGIEVVHLDYYFARCYESIVALSLYNS